MVCQLKKPMCKLINLTTGLSVEAVLFTICVSSPMVEPGPPRAFQLVHISTTGRVLSQNTTLLLL